MKSIVYDHYGSPDVLHFEDTDMPILGDDEVLVRVVASAVNPGDWDLLRGTPFIVRLVNGLRKPKNRVLGLALAGRVEAVGNQATRFQVGDEVFAECARGGFAEYASVPESNLAHKPNTLTFEEAAAIPVAGTTALEALRDVTTIQPGDKVLINGASGGVGTFAVQTAKSFGAEVTGVCGPTNVELVRKLGADHVIDYTKQDFATSGQYDVIFDNVGNRSLAEIRQVLARDGTFIPNSNKGRGGFFGAYLRRAIQALATSPFVPQRLRPFSASGTTEHLDAIAEMIDAGELRPVIDRTFPLIEAADALAHYGTGHARGKVVISVEHPGLDW